MTRALKLGLLAVSWLVSLGAVRAQVAPVTVAIVGLEHGHVGGCFQLLTKTENVKLVAVVEKDAELRAKYATRFHLDHALMFESLDAMAAKVKPKAVLIYTAPVRHRAVVEWAAKHGIDAMMEKPFATTLADAVAMRDAGRKFHTRVLVNYETSWYASNAAVLKDVAAGRLGTVRKVVVHDGHQGPEEIHVPAEFLTWLTDPKTNGAGAMFDFGCYGADLLTVMMHGAAPESVTAVAQTDKPAKYAKVDDDATIIVRYKGMQAVLMPSWDWTFSRKDMEVYGSSGYEIADDANNVTARFAEKEKAQTGAAEKLPRAYTNSLEYLAAIERGEISGEGDLSSPEVNVMTMQILEAAKRSAETGKTVVVGVVAR
ncbi:MAG: Gfo/Idh/MocA family oxidoreductase [Acidobacteriota bacterium]